ncbi:hypothetical protein ACFT4A_37300, partial [Streptomyces sp. NPDC057099]|uniref:hypothetical protein n=1 Tax=Streptomyces sp. NPDC057099 TaxID=3346019 RepID=UPI00363C456C
AFLRALPFGLAFPTLSDLSDPISSVLSRFSLSRFPFRRFRLYQKFRAVLTGRSFPNHREWLQ